MTNNSEILVCLVWLACPELWLSRQNASRILYIGETESGNSGTSGK